MEVGDTGHIVCRKTGLRADVDFHQLTLFGSSDRLKSLDGRIYRLAPDGKSKGEELFTFCGYTDGLISITPKGGVPSTFLDIPSLPIAPKRVLPIDEQGPWESRRLWQFATKELNVRPRVDWDAVDKEKSQLEEEQRLLPCHAKAGSPAFAEWPTKKFALKRFVGVHRGGEGLSSFSHSVYRVTDGVTGTVRELYAFTGAVSTPFSEGEPQLNVLALSRDLPDPRGGRLGAGVVEELALAMRGVKISVNRSVI